MRTRSATEAGTGAVTALGERQAFADEMRQATPSAGMITVGEIAVGDQLTQERLADQRGQFLLAAAFAQGLRQSSASKQCGIWR